MSLLSRLFRKTPSHSPAAAAAPPPPARKNDAADRAQAAAAEQAGLQCAIDAGDFAAVARLVVTGASTTVRQAAAQAIEDPALLRQLIRDVRGGKDNTVYKILTAKRDAQSDEARRLAQLQSEIDAAASALERHSRSPHDTSYAPLLLQFETRWETLSAQADAARRESVRQAIERAREVIAAQQRQLAAQAQQSQAAAEAARAAQQQREEQAHALAAAAAEQAQALHAQQRALGEQQAAAQEAIRQIAESIRKARAALGDGGTARAAGLRQAIEEKLALAPPLPAHVASQLQQLDQQLDKLKDWKQFSVAPKRAELIEEMRFLIGASFEPLALSERIKSLQAEWRTLSKGAGVQLDAEAQQFEEATQKAYQPCRDYFAAQALVREENRRQRALLLAQLTAFEADTDWQQADWQAVVARLRDTKQAWRGLAAVDRQAGKPQDEAFTALTASLQGRVDAEHARNVAQKKALIERAQQALASDDNRRAIDEVKRLQQQWRTTGTVPREVDQRLWAEFRQHCDAVFQKREQEAATHAAGLESNKTQAVALCEQIETIALLEGAELHTRAAALGELRTAFEAMGELPRADTRALRSRFDEGMARCKEALARQQRRDAEQAWGDLFDAADRTRAYRLALAQGVDAATLDPLRTAAEARIASVPRWPKGGLEVIQQALADPGAADLAANEAALRMLCIRAEILTDSATPTEDQPLRREVQLQRLVQGMGQRQKADEAPLNGLAIEWVRAGPVEAAAYQSLLQRFRRCRTQS